MGLTDATPQFFETAEPWRAWLAQHHHTHTSLIVGFYKAQSNRQSMTWPESVDEALCYGWIDGVRKRIDDVRYLIRFTPRKSGSIWSAVNIARVAELTAAARMMPSGVQAFEARQEDRSRVYAYEQSAHAALAPEDEARFRAQPAAWAFFSAQAPWYRKQMLWRVVSAKQHATRQRRLALLIDASAAGTRL